MSDAELLAEALAELRELRTIEVLKREIETLRNRNAN